MSRANVICENCRSANHRECQAAIPLSTSQEGRIRKTSFVCCDNVVSWIDQTVT